MNEFHFTQITKWQSRTKAIPRLAVVTTRMLRFVVLLCIGLYGANLNAQCPDDNVLEGGPTAITADGIPVGLTTTINAGEFHLVSVMVGNTYVFETCGDTDFDTHITLYGGAGLLGSNDDDCGVQSLVAYSPTVTEDIRVLVDEGAACGSNSLDMTLTATATPNACPDCSGVVNDGLFCLSNVDPPSSLINLDACASTAVITTEPDVVTTITGNGSGYFGNAQLVTRTYTIDQDGDLTTVADQTQCSHALTIESTQLSINCPPSVEVTLESGECGKQVFFNPPTSGGACGSRVITQAFANPVNPATGARYESGDIFPEGTTTLVFVVNSPMFPLADSVTCDIEITVNGNPNQSNQMACSSANISVDEACALSLSPAAVLVGDNYGCLDGYEVSLHECPTCPALIVFDGTNTFDATSYIDQQLVVKVTSPAPLSNSCWNYRLIEDKLGPEITCSPDPIEVNCGESTEPEDLGIPEAIDNCEGMITPTYNDVIGDTYCPSVPADPADPPYQTITRTWTATDSKGNTATCEQTININRPTLQEIVCPVSRDGQPNNEAALVCNSNFPTDANGHPSTEETGEPNFGGTPIMNMCMFNFAEGANGLPYTDIVFPGDCEGNITYKRTWMILDMCSGDMESCTQTIKVIDTDGPTITQMADATANAYSNCLANFIVPTPTITDVCSPTGINYSVSVSAGTVVPFGSGHIVNNLPIGTHVITYTAYDGCDNSSTCSFQVTVEDHQAPVLPCQTYTTVGLSNDGSEVHWNTFLNLSNVTDNCGLDSIIVRRMDMPHCTEDDSTPYAETVPFFCCDIGDTVTVEVRAIDIYGNANTCMVFATVADNVAPIFSPCPADRAIFCNDLTTLATYDDVTADDDGTEDVPASGPLTYIISTNDSGGLDTTFYGYYNNNIWDNCDTEVYISTTGSVNDCGNSVDANGALLPLQRTYTAVDQSGNVSAPCVQEITVTNPDTFNPIYDLDWPNDYTSPGAFCGSSILPDDLPVNFQRPEVLPNSTAGCDNLAMGYADSDPLYPVGGGADFCYKILRTWTVMDWCGNSTTTNTQVIMIVDPGPVFTGCDNPNDLADGATLVLEPIAMNNCASPAVAVDVTYSVDLNDDGSEEITDNPGIINEVVGVGTNFPEGTHKITFTAQGCTASSTCDVFVTVLPMAPPSAMSNVSGAISNESNSMVENVTVTPATGMGSYVTDINGAYDMNLATSENYNVTPEKDDDYLNGVSTYDIVLMSKHILQIETLNSPYKMIAADVNKSGSITTLDMVELRKVILFINDEFTNNTSWRFVDANYAFPDATNPFGEIFPESYAINGLTGDMEDLDFVAVKTGDVNGTAVTNGFNGDADSRDFDGTLELEMKDVQLKAGQTQTIEVKANDFNHLLGYQFTMAFDGLEVTDVTAGELTSLTAANFGMQRLQEGVLTTSWNNNEAVSLADGTVLFTVTVRATADVQLSDVLRASSQYTVAEAYADKAGNVEVMDVEFAFRDNNGATIASEFGLYQNRPNPFKDETVIGFDLPQVGKAQINVYDLSGRVLLNVSGTYTKGYNEVSINRSDLPGTGVLYYELATEYNSAVRKMTIIE